MAGSQRVYKQRIKSTQSLKKMFRAQELIAASRIGKARARTSAASPYARALTRAVSAVATHTSTKHPLTSERTDTNRVAVLVVASDRGMAGAYSASILRETERLVERLTAEGKEVALYISGRRAESYYRFRKRELAAAWTGQSDAPTSELAEEIASTGKLGDELEQQLASAVDEFRANFLKADGTPLTGSADSDEAAEVEQEQIVRQKKG